MKNQVTLVALLILSTGLFAVAQQTAKPKVGPPPGTITGSGTAHYIPIFDGTTTIENSTVYETLSGNVGIGTTTPATTLDVVGAINTNTGISFSGQPFAYSEYSNTDNFFGYSAGNTSMIGPYNVGLGDYALVLNTSGSANTAAGSSSLISNTTGANNTGIGAFALSSNAVGGENTAVGANALKSTTASANTAVGQGALWSDTTGGLDTGAGLYALANNTTGIENTALGAYSGPDSGSPSLTNATAIGAYSVVSQSNSLILGGAGAYVVKVGIGTAAPSNVFTIAQGAGHAISDAWDTYSSKRIKTNVRTIDGALTKVQHLRGVSYDRKDTGKHEIGVIAEEVNNVVPEIVSKSENGKDVKGVDYSRLTALLIEAVKEQQREILSEREKISHLTEELHRQDDILRAQNLTMGNRGSERNNSAKVLRSRSHSGSSSSSISRKN